MRRWLNQSMYFKVATSTCAGCAKARLARSAGRADQTVPDTVGPTDHQPRVPSLRDAPCSEGQSTASRRDRRTNLLSMGKLASVGMFSVGTVKEMRHSTRTTA